MFSYYYVAQKRRLLFLELVLISNIFLAGCAQNKQAQGNDPWKRVKKLKTQIRPPTFPDNKFLITDYGARGDGKTKNTKAFKEAINVCNKQGGGQVVVPRGVFLTGAIHLKNDVNLHLKKGAKILFSRNTKDYLPVVRTWFAGIELMNYSPFIYAYDKNNIAITGSGILDGNANKNHWWPWKGFKKYGWAKGDPNHRNDWSLLKEMNKKQVPPKKRMFGAGHYLRPNFIETYNCKNILIKGITILHSPMWQIHPVVSESVIIDNVHFNSLGPNNEGVNPEFSKDVWIKNCYFNTGDDCIAIKSGRNQDGRRIDKPSKNIIVENSRMKNGHGGIVIGSETSGGIKNVYAHNLTMDSPNLDRVLRIKSNSNRGGIIQNINLKDIQVGTYREAAIKINMFYGPGGHKFRGPAGNFMPIIRDITVENLKVKNGGKYGIFIKTYKKSPVKNIKISNSTIKSVDIPTEINYAKNLIFNGVKINGKTYNYNK